MTHLQLNPRTSRQLGANEGQCGALAPVICAVEPSELTCIFCSKRQLVTQAEAITTVRFQRERDWRKPLPALITDGRIVLGATIHPTEGGHTMLVTGRLALARPNGEVDAQSAGFLEVLHFVWVAEASHFTQLSRLMLQGCACRPTRHAARPVTGVSYDLGCEQSV